MALYKWLTAASWLLYFLVYIGICFSKRPRVFHSRFDEGDIKRSGIDGSVNTVNGKVFVNWSTIGPWNSSDVNFTVYFLTNYSNNDMSPSINITTCFATSLKNDSWKIVPSKGNLLKFCSESQMCGPFDESVLFLVNSNWMPVSKELSCHLFTTCSDFNSTYGIQITAVTNRRQYSYYIGNLSIYSQNIPPPPTNLHLSKQTTKNQIGISWDYLDPSQLCGFGSNVRSAIHFVIEYYKSNHCLFMGNRTVNFNEHSTKFSNISRQNNKYIFYFSAVSSINNLISRPWRKQIAANLNKDVYDKCFVQDGILSISWQPEWNCHKIDVVERAMFCPYEGKPCIPVCQGILFKNGAIEVTSFSRNLLNFCTDPSICQINSNGTDMVDVTWLRSSGTMTCHLFKQCTTYLSIFKIRLVTFALSTSKRMAERMLCPRVHFLENNHPPQLKHFHVVAKTQSSVTVTWTFHQCKTFNSVTKFNISGKQLQGSHRFETMIAFESVRQNYTIKNLYPFTSYEIEIHAENPRNIDSANSKPNSARLTVQTKEGAPLRSPDITDIIREKHGIRLTWKFRWFEVSEVTSSIFCRGEYNDPLEDEPLRRHLIISQRSTSHLREPLQGIPRLVFIEILIDKNNTAFNSTFNGTNITSVVIHDGIDVKKCYFFRVKVCNLPGLCSPFSEPKRFQYPCGEKGNPNEGSLRSKVFSRIWIVIFVSLSIAAVTLILLVWCKRRRRRRPGDSLPHLTHVPMECETDYMGIGSMPNEYDVLQSEDLFMDK